MAGKHLDSQRLLTFGALYHILHTYPIHPRSALATVDNDESYADLL